MKADQIPGDPPSRDVPGLPVAGYAPTVPAEAVALVNEGKLLEERVRRYFDRIQYGPGTVTPLPFNPRLLAMARSEIEKGFMLAFKSIFQPGDGRIAIPEDAEGEL